MKLPVVFPEDRTPEEIEKSCKELKDKVKIKRMVSKGKFFCDNKLCLYHDVPMNKLTEPYLKNGYQFCSKECYEFILVRD